MAGIFDAGSHGMCS